MRAIILLLALAACGDDVSSPSDMARNFDKVGDPCGGDMTPVDPAACGPGYLCKVVGSNAAVCVILSGKGEGCGGNTATPAQCELGLTCKFTNVPDVGGTCQ